MTSTDAKNIEKICLWCGKDTNGDNTREHIFPNCIGGKKMLHQEYTHEECTQQFSHRIDRALLKEHPLYMDAYQVDFGIERKGKRKQDKERYKEEKKDIQGVGKSKNIRITRKNNTVNLVDTSFRIVSSDFIRSLHKCVANVLCDVYGPSYVRKNYPELIDFVKNGGDINPWSYAFSSPNLLHFLKVSEPQTMRWSIAGNKNEIICWLHTSGIWMVGTSPYLLSPQIIEKISNSIIKDITLKKDNKTLNLPKPLNYYFGNYTFPDNEKGIGELNFIWVFKEIEGTPNPDFLYLLTKCKVCGQTNPTGLTLPREIIYNGDINNMTNYPPNTWNNYSDEELKKIGFNLDEWKSDKLENLKKKQGLRIPEENDVKKMNITDCYCQCINCGNQIKFSAEDCFI